jgi:hypothetical protein
MDQERKKRADKRKRSNLVVKNEGCVGASEGRLGQLREKIKNEQDDERSAD